MAKYYTVKLTQRQLDALISLAELTDERSSLTYGDWAESNPREMPALKAAENALRSADCEPEPIGDTVQSVLRAPRGKKPPRSKS